MQSEHPLFRRFPNELNIGSHWLEWTTRGADLFARPSNGNLEIVWCWPGQYNAALRGGNQTVLQAIQREKARRFWPMPNGEHLLLQQTFGFLHSPASVFVMRFGITRHLFPSDVLSLTGAPMLQAIEELDRSDELQLVRLLMTKTRDPWSWVHWTQGSHLEFESLLRSLFVLAEFGSFGYAPWHPNRDVDFEKRVSLSKIGVEQESHTRLKRLLSLSFQAKTSPHLWRICNSKCAHCPAPYLSLKAAPEEPSQHERLEALLLWRDFLRDKLLPGEIDALLLPQ